MLNLRQPIFIKMLHKAQVSELLIYFVMADVSIMRNYLLLFQVPFIDTQAVEAIPPRPLTGAGIYFKTSPGYGGFIGPMIAVDPVHFRK